MDARLVEKDSIKLSDWKQLEAQAEAQIKRSRMDIKAMQAIRSKAKAMIVLLKGKTSEQEYLEQLDALEQARKKAKEKENGKPDT